MSSADPLLQGAIEEAKTGLREGGLPIGSVQVYDGKIIGRGHNRRVQRGDPMAHAEIDCLTMRFGRFVWFDLRIAITKLSPNLL
jgi:tRNA(Arg) A34 adenosine deaminase TadA